MSLWSIFFLLFFSIPEAQSGINLPWENTSDPLIMSRSFKRNFQELPLSGQISNPQTLWSGDYWALNKGNINFRWYGEQKRGFKLHSPTKDEALRMSIPELAALSPSEKYDLLTGRYDYPLKNEVEKRANPQAQTWEGICHGWAPATMNHQEPAPKFLRNPDGIEIPFGSTDIKALLSYYYAYGFESPNHQMGLRCYNGIDSNCQQDLNAGAFHIVLTNKLGFERASFIADIRPGREVWNHPIHSFSSSIIIAQLPTSRSSAEGAVKVIRIRTRVRYADGGENRWQTVIGSQFQNFDEQVYEYDLDIDAYGNIIGGEWRSKLRPDFIWTKPRPRKFIGSLFRLHELIND